MKNKTKNKLKWILSAFIAVVIAGGAVMKLVHAPELVEIYSRIGLLPYLEILGIVEFLFVGLFLWPRTMKAGFLLLTGYYGGAMAVELSHAHVFIFPALILTFIWIAAYLREPSLFKSAPKRRETQTAI